MSYQIKRLETDVLVIGGGISGALAAIEAAGQGLNVIVMEKSHTARSGNAGSGIDHIFSYIPEIHEKAGYSMERMKEEQNRLEYADIGLGFRELNDYFVEHSYKRILGLEKYGLKFRFEDSTLPGGYRVVTQFHSIPTSFNFEGRDIKPILTKEMEKAGVHILNRVFAVEILKQGEKASGAIGVGTREEILYAVTARATILATAGGVDRLAKCASGADFERFHAASMNNGAGKVLAMNAGADVINLEYMPSKGAFGWLNWSMSAGSPGGTYWPCARVVDEDGNIVVERGEAFDLSDSDYVKKHTEQSKRYAKQRREMVRQAAEGKQLYLDFSEATEEELAYIKWSLSHEGKCNVLLENMDWKGVDFKEVKIPYCYSDIVQTFAACSGVYVNARCETTVENLYAAGNEIGGMSNNSAPEAVVYGIEAGIRAAEHVKKEKRESNWKPEAEENAIRRIAEMLAGFAENAESGQGEKWIDAEHAVQNIVNTFGSVPHTDEKCEAALKLLDSLERERKLSAENPHETGRCLDVVFLTETAKAMFAACLNRKESYGPFIKKNSLNGQEKSKAQAVIYGVRKENGSFRFREIR